MNRSQIENSEGINAEEIVLISGFQTLEDDLTLGEYGVQDGKSLIHNTFPRINNQHGAKTCRRQEKEKEEGLHKAQKDKAQAQKETQSPP